MLKKKIEIIVQSITSEELNSRKDYKKYRCKKCGHFFIILKHSGWGRSCNVIYCPKCSKKTTPENYRMCPSLDRKILPVDDVLKNQFQLDFLVGWDDEHGPVFFRERFSYFSREMYGFAGQNGIFVVYDFIEFNILKYRCINLKNQECAIEKLHQISKHSAGDKTDCDFVFYTNKICKKDLFENLLDTKIWNSSYRIHISDIQIS